MSCNTHPKTIVSLLLCVSLLILSGCQTTKKAYQPSNVKLSELNHWQIKARIAVTTPEDNVTATLDWKKLGNNFDFHVYGTFGVTYAHLTQIENTATLKMPDDQIFYHQDAEQLLYQSLGWDFPINALSAWIKGLPSGQSGELVTRAENGNVETIQLNGWQVKFQRYQDYSGFSMPKIIKATHPQMTLKVVIRDWQFLPRSEKIER